MRESDFGTSRTKGLRGIDKSLSEAETTGGSGRFHRKKTISRKGASIGNRKWKGVQDNAINRRCRRESRPRAVRNRWIAKIAQKGASRTFSARFEDRKRFVVSNDRSRHFERSETTPESLENRRFPKGAPTKSKPTTRYSSFRKIRSRRDVVFRSDPTEEFANKVGT